MKILHQNSCNDLLTLPIFVHSALKIVVFDANRISSTASDNHFKIIRRIYI